MTVEYRNEGGAMFTQRIHAVVIYSQLNETVNTDQMARANQQALVQDHITQN